MQERIGDVFVAMGYEVAEGPEVEHEWFNFDALNIGPDHPARTMQDTFWVGSPESGVVLRTHTSPVQARTMLTREPPIYVDLPGPDLSHRRARRDPHAGLPPGRGARRRRGHHDGAPARARSTTSPRRCSAPGCGPGCGRPTSRSPSRPPRSTCSASSAGALGRARRRALPGLREGWIEWGGCGMVNPRVLRRLRHRPRALQRLRLRHGHRAHADVPARRQDMRDMVEGDVRFTLAFGMEV